MYTKKWGLQLWGILGGVFAVIKLKNKIYNVYTNKIRFNSHPNAKTDHGSEPYMYLGVR